MGLAQILQSGQEPTHEQFAATRAAVERLRLEPQPAGFVETLLLVLRAVTGEWE
jgi:hypothetical protein